MSGHPTGQAPDAVAAPGSVTVRVPAKVNVQLAVGAARPDGFHDLANVFLAVSLYDEVTATPAAGTKVTCEGPDADQVPLDRTNLAARAAEILAGRAGLSPDVHLHIAKNIPVAGGMAGGSADGAAALVACDALWGLNTPMTELLDICAELGSDVPFSLIGGAALGTGRGEILTPVPAGAFHWVFAVADGGLSTPAVFREFDRLAAGHDIPAPGRRRPCWPPWPPATPTPSPPPWSTTSSPPPCPCARSSRPSWPPAPGPGRSPRWSRAPDPRRRSWSATPRRRPRSPPSSTPPGSVAPPAWPPPRPPARPCSDRSHPPARP